MPVHGGDINTNLMLLNEDGGTYFLKYNKVKDIISKEYLGLKLLETLVPIPKIILHKVLDNCAFILMEHIEQVQAPAYNKSQKLASNLAQLHKQTALTFGLEHSNFIGSLNQDNTIYTCFFDHYINSRIGPQIAKAQMNGFLNDIDLERYYKYVRQVIKAESPTLIHGDLWNGNVLFGTKESYFIDPAISYSHREFDIAMMRLFGGFDASVYQVYNEIYPLEDNWEKRIHIFQLYYLLVHLNIFGRSYLGSVRKILKLN